MIFIFLVTLTKWSFAQNNPKHVVGGNAHLGNKPWLLYTKKWTGGACDFNTKV